MANTPLLGDYYVHCQTEYWYVDENNQRFCNTTVCEDTTCSDSMGPAYNIDDHRTYLGVDYGECVFGQPAPWLAIPGVLQPANTVPKFPKRLSSFFVDTGDFVLSLIG